MTPKDIAAQKHYDKFSMYIVNNKSNAHKITREFESGAEWLAQKINDEIEEALDESFVGWSDEQYNAYLTACRRIQEKVNNLINKDI